MTERAFLQRALSDPGALLRAHGDEQGATRLLEAARWPQGVACVGCGSRDTALIGSVRGTSGRRKWRCRQCARQFTVRTGTWLEGGKFPMDAVCLALGLWAQHGSDGLSVRLTDAGLDRRAVDRFLLTMLPEMPERGEVPRWKKVAFAVVLVAWLPLGFGASWLMRMGDVEAGEKLGPVVARRLHSSGSLQVLRAPSGVDVEEWRKQNAERIAHFLNKDTR